MTKKLDIVWCVFVVLSAIGVGVFWYLCWNDNKDTATWLLAISGVFGYIALAAKGLAALRRYNGAID